jgi:hypothetical protein
VPEPAAWLIGLVGLLASVVSRRCITSRKC